MTFNRGGAPYDVVRHPTEVTPMFKPFLLSYNCPQHATLHQLAAAVLLTLMNPTGG